MSTIRAYMDGTYKDKGVFLDSAEIKNARLDFDIHQESFYEFADYDNMIQLSFLPFPIPTPTRHATGIILGEKTIKGSLDIFVGKNMVSLEFVALDVTVDTESKGIMLTGVLFTKVKVS